MYIGIRAVDGEGGVKTSTVLKYRIEDGAPVGTATAEGPTPDVYQQLIAICSNIKDKTDALDSTIQMNTQELGKTKEYLNELTDKKITKFYASNLGENHLEDSDNGKIQDMFIYGRSEQKKYNGYNLFNIQEIRKTYSLEVNSIEHERVDFKMLNTGYCYAEIKLKCASGEKYRFSLSKKHNDLIVIVAGDIGLTNTNTYSWNVQANAPLIFTTKTEIINIRFAVNSTSIIEGIFAENIMLVKNPDSITEYEPYVGGIPSPNPDYPQEIMNVKNPVIKITGKNLFKSETRTGWYHTTNVYVKKGKTYYVYFKRTGLGENNWFDVAYVGDETKSSSMRKVTNNSFVANWDGILILRDDYNDGNGCEISDVYISDRPMTEYEQYKEQEASFPYTLNAIPVSSDGNITIYGQQYISDYIDVESKKLIKMTDSIILKGTENWKKSTSTDSDKFTWTTKDTTAMKRFGYCTHFGVVNGYTNTIGKIYRNEYSGTVQIVINFGVYGKTTLEDFKNWLSNNNVTLTYVRNDKSEINLTDKEINSFKNMQTYYLTTNICITSEELDGYTKFNYPLSMKNGWDYIKQQIGDTRDYIYDMEVETAEAYVNSEYAVALTELEVM